jgi:hypothetical protein
MRSVAKLKPGGYAFLRNIFAAMQTIVGEFIDFALRARRDIESAIDRIVF